MWSRGTPVQSPSDTLQIPALALTYTLTLYKRTKPNVKMRVEPRNGRSCTSPFLADALYTVQKHRFCWRATGRNRHTSTLCPRTTRTLCEMRIRGD